MSGSARPSHPKAHPALSPRPHHGPSRKSSMGSADMLRAVVMAAKKNKQKEKEKGISRQDEDVVKEEEAMAWKLFTLTQINILLEQDIAGVQRYMEMFLNMREPLTSLKQAALLDYYVSGFWWAKSLEFTPVQLGGLLTLLNMLMNNIETRNLTLEENIQELRNAMAGIGRRNSEKSGGFEFFTVDQAKAIINYLKISIFQHYTLYEFLFYTPREELVLGDENVVELVKPANSPFPAPLEEGLAYDIYSRFIAQTPGEKDATKEMEGGVPLEEEAEAETIVDPLTGYTIEDVQMVLGQITGEMLSGIQISFTQKPFFHLNAEVL
ncbi:ciliary-associated calcium-binding coiled-coil protein 1 isoform X2 [Zootoca vivipara]|uniref:ciliary-associated calcium-binding coiled-coil protein 1 isoform X2 n=1 Tax=Zootoca vivipara TaxID=8524 RepID=UPI00293BC20D|nr:ciliary-associated calcium-binding coiled-coil protein 1 isoform X2 [Zootoca vivipara]